MLNQFLGSDCTDTLLPAVVEDQDCILIPRLSQVVGLLILPAGVPGPASWVSQTDMEGLVDNTDTVNAAAKFLIGKGSIEDPAPLVVNLGKKDRVIARRTYAMEFQLSVAASQHYALVQTLQRNYRQFRFWFGTLGGRVFGGQRGIKPEFIDAFTRYGAANTDTEIGVMRVEWWADGDPSRYDMPGLFGVSTPYEQGVSGLLGGGGSQALAQVGFYAQAYENQGSQALTWTENSGELPTTNTRAQVLVFQNGVKLEETVQYSITHMTGPAQSTVTISASTHFIGANYEIIAFTQS